MMKKSFSGVIGLHNRYKRELCNNPGLALFIGLVCSVLFTAVTVLINAIVFKNILLIGVIPVGTIVSVGYVLFMFGSMLFDSFLDERKELFETIKR
jgi:hypothetical protein